jgi:hypothetical protein
MNAFVLKLLQVTTLITNRFHDHVALSKPKCELPLARKMIVPTQKSAYALESRYVYGTIIWYHTIPRLVVHNTICRYVCTYLRLESYKLLDFSSNLIIPYHR